MTQGPGTLSIRDVSRNFGGVVAADKINLSIESGEFVAVVGPNGAGKSTLLQMISGFVRPHEGAIHLGERTISGLAPEAISALGIARSFQTSRVFPSLTVLESILVGTQKELIGGGRNPVRFNAVSELTSALLRLPAYRRKQAELLAQTEAVMKLFGDRLWPRRGDPALSLSYANRRRLEIARALVSRPTVLLLDEPAAGMNPTETDELTQLIASLREREQGMIIVMVEHKLQVVRQLAKRCVVMNQGAVLIDASPAEALDHPSVIEAYLGTRRTAAAYGRTTESG